MSQTSLNVTIEVDSASVNCVTEASVDVGICLNPGELFLNNLASYGALV